MDEPVSLFDMGIMRIERFLTMHYKTENVVNIRNLAIYNGCGSFGTTPVAVSIMQPELRRTGSRGYVDIPVYDGTPNSHLYPCWNEVSES